MKPELQIVYFSSVTENTRKIVDSLGFPAHRIPLRPHDETPVIHKPFIIATPTYGLGTPTTAVPKQVVKFLDTREIRNKCLGVIGGGNRNFGEKYAVAGKFLSHLLEIPFIYSFEIAGTSKDVAYLQNELPKQWDKIIDEYLQRKEDNM